VETRRLGSVSQDTGRPRSDPGRATPGRTMAIRYSAPTKNVEGTSHPSARQKGRSRSEKRSATSACHHPHPSPPSVPEANIPRGPAQPGQIEASDLASILTTKSSHQKKSKNSLFRSDTTDPVAWSIDNKLRNSCQCLLFGTDPVAWGIDNKLINPCQCLLFGTDPVADDGLNYACPADFARHPPSPRLRRAGPRDWR
jgi:hypothetical protein